MKKIISSILIVSVFLSTLSFSSCKNDTNKDENEEREERMSDTSKIEEIILFIITSLTLYGTAGNTLNVILLQPHKQDCNGCCNDNSRRTEGGEVLLYHLTLKPLIHTE